MQQKLEVVKIIAVSLMSGHSSEDAGGRHSAEALH